MHTKLATRFGVSTTRTREDRFNNVATGAPDNTTGGRRPRAHEVARAHPERADPSLDSPDDIIQWQTAAAVDDPRSYHVGPRSVVVLWRRLRNEEEVA